MTGYVIRIKASVEKDIATLPRDVVLRILQGRLYPKHLCRLVYAS